MAEYVHGMNSDEIITVDIALSPSDLWKIDTMVEAGWDRYIATLKVVGDRGKVTITKIGEEAT